MLTTNILRVLILLSVLRQVNAVGVFDTATSLTFSKQTLGEAGTITYSFKYDKAIPSANSDKTLTLALPNFSGTSPVVKIKSGCGSAVFTIDDSGTGSGYTLVLTATANYAANTLCTIEITGVTNPSNVLAANDVSLTHAVNVDTADDDLSATSTNLKSDAIGIPILYYKKSACVDSDGIAADCAEGDGELCKTCSNFVITHGLQKQGDTCAWSATDQGRCDAPNYEENAIDAYFNPNGATGTVVCGAFGKSATAPTTNIMNEVLGTGASALISRNSISITEEGKNKDHVVTLNDLDPGTQYDIYCHGDAGIMSPKLDDVWTRDFLKLWGDSLTVGVTKLDVDPVELVLTFKHGSALTQSAGDAIVLTATIGSAGTGANIFTNDATAPNCAATSNGNMLSITSAVSDTSSTQVLTITLSSGATSAAGSTIVVTCPDNLKLNPSAADYVKYNLKTITSNSGNAHAEVFNRKGWTVTA
jgi:hypothetical protein